MNRRRLPDGTDVPYELASTWYSLMAAIDPEPDRALARHVLSQAFVLALRGIPLLYTHVLLASEQRPSSSYRRSGVARDLNRADVDVARARGDAGRPEFASSAGQRRAIRRCCARERRATRFTQVQSQRVTSARVAW